MISKNLLDWFWAKIKHRMVSSNTAQTRCLTLLKIVLFLATETLVTKKPQFSSQILGRWTLPRVWYTQKHRNRRGRQSFITTRFHQQNKVECTIYASQFTHRFLACRIFNVGTGTSVMFESSEWLTIGRYE